MAPQAQKSQKPNKLKPFHDNRYFITSATRCKEMQQKAPKGTILSKCLSKWFYARRPQRHFPITREYETNLFGIALTVKSLAYREHQFTTWVNGLKRRVVDLLLPFRGFRYYHATFACNWNAIWYMTRCQPQCKRVLRLSLSRRSPGRVWACSWGRGRLWQRIGRSFAGLIGMEIGMRRESWSHFLVRG